MLQSGGTVQRNINIAPSRGNVQVNREATVVSPRNGGQSEPVRIHFIHTKYILYPRGTINILI